VARSGRLLTLCLVRGSRMLPPARRTIEVRVAGENTAKTIAFTGRPLEVRIG
jgi:hypothetical protein